MVNRTRLKGYYRNGIRLLFQRGHWEDQLTRVTPNCAVSALTGIATAEIGQSARTIRRFDNRRIYTVLTWKDFI